MYEDHFERQQRWINLGVFAFVAAGLAWFLSPGIPVVWGPSASTAKIDQGRDLFEHEWKMNDPKAHGDGLGPVFNARSCAACHFQGGVGGGGDNKHNVATFEVHPGKSRPAVECGVVHKFAVERNFKESSKLLAERFPMVRGLNRVVNGCTISVPDFNPVRQDSINSTALFGAGWIDRISSKAIAHNQFVSTLAVAKNDFSLDFSAVQPGRARILPDGRIGKFGWKAQFATLEEFVASACAVEIGLGTPSHPQAKPFGMPNYPDCDSDLDGKQFAALVAFVDTLPRPQICTPIDSAEAARAERGAALFRSVGCAVCHVPDLGGVEGIYSDLLLHRIHHRDGDGTGDGYLPPIPDVPFPSRHPAPDEWKTPPLWGVADSAPYLHDGSASTLDAAIQRHRGTATPVTTAFNKLAQEDRKAVIAFLKTLKAPTQREATRMSNTQLAAR